MRDSGVEQPKTNSAKATEQLLKISGGVNAHNGNLFAGWEKELP